MVKLGDLIFRVILPKKYSFQKGDLILINICFVRYALNILLTGKIDTVENRPRKIRPIIIYEIKGNNAYFIALSTNEKFSPNLIINFDYSNCEIKNCDQFNFKNNAYIFIFYEKIKRNGKFYRKKAKFKFNIDRLNNLLNSPEYEFIKEKCDKFDLINFCGRCNLKYLDEIVNLIEKFYE